MASKDRIVEVLVAMATADGAVGPQERHLLETACALWGVAPKTLDEALARARAGKLPLRIPKAQEDRRLLLNALATMAAADGAVTQAERTLLKAVAAHVGADPYAVAEILHRALEQSDRLRAVSSGSGAILPETDPSPAGDTLPPPAQPAPAVATPIAGAAPPQAEPAPQAPRAVSLVKPRAVPVEAGAASPAPAPSETDDAVLELVPVQPATDDAVFELAAIQPGIDDAVLGPAPIRSAPASAAAGSPSAPTQPSKEERSPSGSTSGRRRFKGAKEKRSERRRAVSSRRVRARPEVGSRDGEGSASGRTTAASGGAGQAWRRLRRGLKRLPFWAYPAAIGVICIPLFAALGVVLGTPTPAQGRGLVREHNELVGRFDEALTRKLSVTDLALLSEHFQGLASLRQDLLAFASRAEASDRPDGRQLGLKAQALLGREDFEAVWRMAGYDLRVLVQERFDQHVAAGDLAKANRLLDGLPVAFVDSEAVWVSKRREAIEASQSYGGRTRRFLSSRPRGIQALRQGYLLHESTAGAGMSDSYVELTRWFGDQRESSNELFRSIVRGVRTGRRSDARRDYDILRLVEAGTFIQFLERKSFDDSCVLLLLDPDLRGYLLARRVRLLHKMEEALKRLKAGQRSGS